MEINEIIEKLKNGENNKVYKDLIVTGVTVGELVDRRQQVSLTLNKDIETILVDKDSGEIRNVKSNVVFITTIAAIAVLKQSGAAFLKDLIRDKAEKSPKSNPIITLFCDAKIDIVQEFVKAGTEYTNPFSVDGKATVFETDRYFSHVIKMTISDENKELLRQIKLNSFSL